MKIISDFSVSGWLHRPRLGLPQPGLRLDFTAGAYHPGGFGAGLTFTRGGTGSYTDATGVMRMALTDQPRLDYNPATGAINGLLLEGAASNLLLFSEQFEVASWLKSNAAIVANAGLAPDGQATADKLVPTTGLSQHRVEYATTIPAGQPYTFSAYVKAAGYGFVWLRIGAAGSSIVSLATGAVSPTATVTSVTNTGNGWWRVAITALSGGSDTVRINALTGPVAADFSGDGSAGILVWGAQLEAGEAVTSYIPTAAATATRAADSLEMSLAGWWPGAAAGSLLAEFISPPVAQQAFVCGFNTAAQANSIALIKANATNTGAGTYLSGLMFDAAATLSGKDAGLTAGPHRVAMGWGAGGMIGAVNGSLGPLGAQRAAVPSKFWLGGRDGGQMPLNGHLRRVVCYPKRLTDAQLITLTQ